MLHALPQKLTRLRELHALPVGSVILASSAPDPRYFRRVVGGWHACDAYGDTALHELLVRELDGWPIVLPNCEIRRPVALVARPDDLPRPVLVPELAEVPA